MTTRRAVPALSFMLLCIVAPTFAQEPEFPLYMGREVCVECHALQGQAKPCALDAPPKHLEAYEALTRAEAADVAALSGVFEQPTRSLLCLGCHATGSDAGPRWMAGTFDISDGVQCEACHGYGTLHNRDGDWVQEARNSCVVCHDQENSPEFEYDAYWAKIAH